MTKTLSKELLPKASRQKPLPNDVPLTTLRPGLNKENGLANHPLWPELLAEIAANRQTDLERDARDYAE